MINWEDIKDINVNNPPNCRFMRKPEDEIKYKNYLIFLKKKSLTPHKNILDNIIGNNIYKLVKNTFPYDLDKEIDHWILWINPKNKLTFQEIDNLLKNKFRNFVYFSNLEKNKSIKTIEHYQIFVCNS